MGLFTGKKGIIMGVANEYSLASGVADFLKKEGAEIGLSHLPDKEGGPAKMLRRVMRVAEPLGITFVRPCDVSNDADIARFFGEVREQFGTIDFFVHSIAYAPMDDISVPPLTPAALVSLTRWTSAATALSPVPAPQLPSWKRADRWRL